MVQFTYIVFEVLMFTLALPKNFSVQTFNSLEIGNKTSNN